ncbi:hypothetical protein NE237_003733 [Protea cynaroides]|uniref:Uncharacterized protein n=1 Tax=Protea cynaroides TaxID=273540 RepID=A0A9Q0QT05_9MAGN|nr:hypothetical protein NE237_003733 [Protea cynaroides]
MGRAPCCDKANVKKGPWSPEEDNKLKEFIQKNGTGGLKRCGKSCRLRWLNYLRPNIKHGEFSDEEDRIICSLFASIGSRWSIIAAHLPGRTDNDIKNYWNTKLKKKLMGLIPPNLYQRKNPDQQSFPPSHHLQTLTSSSSYKGFNSTTNYYTPTRSNFTISPEPISIPATNLLSNTRNISMTMTTPSTASLLQAQTSFVGPTYHYQVKDNLLMFGGTEPSCSSSDASCSNQISYGKEIDFEYGGGVNGEQQQQQQQQHMGLVTYPYNGVGENQEFLVGSNNGGQEIDGWQWSTEKPNGMWGEVPLEYELEEIKQVINNSNGCGNSFFVDENETVKWNGTSKTYNQICDAISFEIKSKIDEPTGVYEDLPRDRLIASVWDLPIHYE